MTHRLLTTTMLAFFLLFLACNDGNEQEATANSEEPAETVAEPTTAPPAAAPNSGVAMVGDNYQITVLDDSLKSPRKELTGELDGVEIKINYGSPAVNGRTVYGNLVPYGAVWRTGANEATRITFSSPVLFGTEEKAVPAGTYSLFTQAEDLESWTFIINKVSEQWGAYDYSEDMDVARAAGTGATAEEKAERMDFSLSDESIELRWENLVVSVPVKGQSR